MTLKRRMPAIDVDALGSGLRSGVTMSRSDDRAAARSTAELSEAFRAALTERDATLRAEMQAALDRRTSEMKKLQKDVDNAINEAGDYRREANQLMDSVRFVASRRGGSFGGQSLGQAVAEHDLYREFQAGRTGKVTMVITTADPSTSPGTGAVVHPHVDPAIVPLARRPQFPIRGLMNSVPVTSGSVKYSRQVTRTNAAAPVAEAASKPESNYAWEEADAAVRTVAHHITVSRQAFDDAAALANEIDTELRYGLDLTEESQPLKGSGVGQNLPGLVTEATAFAAPFVISGATMRDNLLLAVAQLAAVPYIPDAIVLHPLDYFRVQALKDGDGKYLLGSPMAQLANVLWQTPLYMSLSMSQDEFLVGNVRMAATIYDRMETEVLISSEHSDNFTKNLLTIRAEKRLALAVKRPTALIRGDFGFVP